MAALATPAIQAASISLTPASSTVALGSGTTTLELFMDFTGQPTIGGGIDLDLTGPISVASFTPSTFFTTATDPAFTGYGVAHADADFQVHFGNFAGLSGVNKLGDLTLNLLDGGSGHIGMAINTWYGSFFSTGSTQQTVALSGADVNIVPLPPTAWLLATGFGFAGAWRRRRPEISTTGA